jgi:hypothetical protein
MGLDIYFEKFGFGGTQGYPLVYQDWFGDVYTEIDVEQHWDWDAYKYIHPEHADIDEYDLVAMGGDRLEFARRMKNGHNSETDRIVIDYRDVPTKNVTVRRVPVRKVGYFRMGYGCYLLGEPEDIDIGQLWASFDKHIRTGGYVSKQEFMRLMKLPEFEKLANRSNVSQYPATLMGADAIDFDVAYISW